MYYTTNYSSPIGTVTLASDGENLVGLWLEGQKYFCSSLKKETLFSDEKLPVFSSVKDWLDCYFAGEKPDIKNLSLAPSGSTFRQDVWKLLCEIPYGEVTTYGSLAEQMARRLCRQHMSAQAVGGAVAHNPISIIIPCHRVIGANGSLTGYAGGMDKKIWLLTHEGAKTEKMTVPIKGTAL